MLMGGWLKSSRSYHFQVIDSGGAKYIKLTKVAGSQGIFVGFSDATILPYDSDGNNIFWEGLIPQVARNYFKP